MALFDIFTKKDIEERDKKIDLLESKINKKEKEIQRLVYENESLKFQIEKQENDAKTKEKQTELFDKNLKESREENTRLSSILRTYGIQVKKEYHQYKVELTKLYASTRYDEVVKYLQEKGYFYLSDIPFEEIKEELFAMKNGELAYARHQDYLQGKYDWEVSTWRNKGEKLTKIFGRSKKIGQFFADYYLAYMDDLDRVDLKILQQYGFNNAEIEEIHKKREEYYREFRER